MCRRNRLIDGTELAMALGATEQYVELACETMDDAWDVFML